MARMRVQVVKPKDLNVLMAPCLDLSQIPQCVGGQGEYVPPPAPPLSAQRVVSSISAVF